VKTPAVAGGASALIGMVVLAAVLGAGVHAAASPIGGTGETTH